MSDDLSTGYEAIADDYMSVRSDIGKGVVRRWARQLSSGGSVIDLGAGSGEPITSILVEEGLEVFAIDASPTMVAAFKRRFPEIEIACEPVEASPFFNRRFDGVLAVGLMFLLTPEEQEALIAKMAGALKHGGRVLFSASHQICTWDDVMTGQQSQSLGRAEYIKLLMQNGFVLRGEYDDEGGNHYYDAQLA